MTDQQSTPLSADRAEALPCAVLIEGSLGSGVLIPGVTYRVAEVREHWEPSAEAGDLPHITTIVRFDPASLDADRERPSALDVEALANILRDIDGLGMRRNAEQWARFILTRAEAGAENRQAVQPEHVGPHFVGEFDKKGRSRTCPACTAAQPEGGPE